MAARKQPDRAVHLVELNRELARVAVAHSTASQEVAAVRARIAALSGQPTQTTAQKQQEIRFDPVRDKPRRSGRGLSRTGSAGNPLQH